MVNEFKYNYIAIPATAIILSISIHAIINGNIEWYQSLAKPSFTPSHQLFGFMCLLTTASIATTGSVIWNKVHNMHEFKIISLQIMAVIALLFAHTVSMFMYHDLKMAFVLKSTESLVMIALTRRLFKQSPPIALLIAPYTIWNIFLSILNYNIFNMNITH